jgi:hypothetical protein
VAASLSIAEIAKESKLGSGICGNFGIEKLGNTDRAKLPCRACQFGFFGNFGDLAIACGYSKRSTVDT